MCYPLCSSSVPLRRVYCDPPSLDDMHMRHSVDAVPSKWHSPGQLLAVSISLYDAFKLRRVIALIGALYLGDTRWNLAHGHWRVRIQATISSASYHFGPIGLNWIKTPLRLCNGLRTSGASKVGICRAGDGSWIASSNRMTDLVPEVGATHPAELKPLELLLRPATSRRLCFRDIGDQYHGLYKCADVEISDQWQQNIDGMPVVAATHPLGYTSHFASFSIKRTTSDIGLRGFAKATIMAEDAWLRSGLG
ncbi:hypothetical protein EDB89DRAFT_2246436 [Lactarius sanguifluus]|nr:hypothetical protein EDB89DRAFT_2246436 [Lactarius sanguifluus]